MKIAYYVVAILSPVLYVSPWFQNLPLCFRAYLPAVVMLLLYRKGHRLLLVYALYSAVLMDSLVSPAIGAFVILNGFILLLLHYSDRLLPKPSPFTLGLMAMILGYGLELVILIAYITLGWGVHPMERNLFLAIPFATALFTWIIGHFALDLEDDYSVIRRDDHA